jgi:hypothetical protein
MIEFIAALVQLGMFAIWKSNDLINILVKAMFLILAAFLGFEALREFGYLIKV